MRCKPGSHSRVSARVCNRTFERGVTLPLNAALSSKFPVDRPDGTVLGEADMGRSGDTTMSLIAEGV